MQLLVIIPPSKWQICVSCMKEREIVLVSYLIVSLPLTIHIAFSSESSTTKLFSSAAQLFFLFSPSLKRRRRRSNNSRKLNFVQCAIVVEEYFLFLITFLPCSIHFHVFYVIPESFLLFFPFSSFSSSSTSTNYTATK